MGLVALLISAFLFSPQPGRELRVSDRDAVKATVSASRGTEGRVTESCCVSRSERAPKAPCVPGDGCCAVCASCTKRLQDAVPEPAQRPAAGRPGRPEPRAEEQHPDLVWHPPKR